MPAKAVDGRSAPSVATSGRRVAMAVYGDITHDSRVQREAETLHAAGYDVTLHCLGGDVPGAPYAVVRHRPRGGRIPGAPGEFGRSEGSRISGLVRRVAWIAGYIRGARAWGRLVVASADRPDIWHLHDFNALAAVAPLLDAHARIVYDSHELFLEYGTALRLPRLARSVLAALERRLIRRCVLVITVNDGLAGELSRRYRPRRLVVVRNCPPRWTPPQPLEPRLREALDIPESSPVVLFHGAIVEGRGIAALATAVGRMIALDVHLVLMGSGDQSAAWATTVGSPAWAGRMHVLPPVAPADLLSWVASADVGAVLIEPHELNLILSTPNKLFECIASGLPVVASDLPEIRRVVLEDPDAPLGLLADPTDEASIADALDRLVSAPAAERAALRARSLAAAHRRWNWEHEAAELLAAYPR